MEENKKYDAVILGGGLAGLTLALQLKNIRKDINILILEQRDGDAPESAHKVGESTVELGTYYLRNILGLGDYLDKHQLPKYGLRFFFSPEHKNEIHRRVELGATFPPPLPSHQIDRGIFENYLIKLLREKGVDILMGAAVKDCDINYEGHSVNYSCNGRDTAVKAQWVVDGSGRRSILKHQVGFKKEMDHNSNAVWFRIKGKIDVEDWTAKENWNVQLDPDFRRLATVHLMGEGYWVWLIPLVSDNTSVGIVTDPDIHPFEKLNRFDRAMDWLNEHEPLCHDEIENRKDDVLDFKALRHYAHHSEEVYSPDRWAVTGDAGAFIDPFYSPGTDFIGMNNSWITDLIDRDLNGEDIHVRTMAFNRTHLNIVDSWIPIYQNKYKLFGNAQIMAFKIYWDWATYWAIPSLLFTNKGYTNMDVMRKMVFKSDGVVQQFAMLNASVQRVFEEWNNFEHTALSDHYFDPFTVDFMIDFHEGMIADYSDEELISKVKVNLKKLEKIAVQMFRKISHFVHGTAIDIDADPYTMTLLDQNQNVQLTEVIEIPQTIVQDVDRIWIYE